MMNIASVSINGSNTSRTATNLPIGGATQAIDVGTVYKLVQLI